MVRTRRRYLAAVSATLAIAGCTGGSPGDDTPSSSPTPTNGPTETPLGTVTNDELPTVRVSDHPEYGEILVDGGGMTLYMFDSDARGEGSSACYDGCASAWPPLTIEGEPVTGENVGAELTTFEREGGDRQVAGNGWPLYSFASDSEPGDAAGQGVNGVWWVLTPAGVPIRPAATETTGSSSGPGY